MRMEAPLSALSNLEQTLTHAIDVALYALPQTPSSGDHHVQHVEYMNQPREGGGRPRAPSAPQLADR
jgi:hypothetical protein